MLNPIILIEKLLYFIRDAFWNYPDLILEDSPTRRKIIRSYTLSIPYSHFALSAFVCLICIVIFFTPFRLPVFGSVQNKIIEGVIMGSDNLNRPQKLSKINPLLPTNIQLEKDIVDLIYEPLIKYEFIQKDDGTYATQIRDQLAERVTLIQQGADYQFDLKQVVKWHDGRSFTAEDVIATFDLLSSMPETNAYVRTLKQLNWQKVDDYTVRICTKSETSELENCDKTKNKRKISNLLELISFKIVPKHRIQDITQANFETSQPQIYRSPVGTGKFKYFNSDDYTITLTRNLDYYERSSKGQINTIIFKYYKALEDGVRAIQNGEVHTLSSSSIEYLKQMEDYNNININLSPVLFNQYWSLYFNLAKNPDGNPKAQSFLTDVKVRQAISSAINREEIIKAALLSVGEEALGPINKESDFFSDSAKWYRYNLEVAKSLLDEAGWTLKSGSKYRTDSTGTEMSFSLYFVNSFDRSAVARVIKQNLESIGINVIIDRKEQPGQSTVNPDVDGWSLSELSTEILAPKSFDVILYGINTFIDPDRYELFHSSQCDFPKLNFSCYIGSAITVKPNPNRQSASDPSTVTLPKVDELLERGRARDPLLENDKRLLDYKEMQDLLAEDAPVIFLYHPKFIYYSNSSIKNINLQNVSSLEERFRNIDEWSI